MLMRDCQTYKTCENNSFRVAFLARHTGDWRGLRRVRLLGVCRPEVPPRAWLRGNQVSGLLPPSDPLGQLRSPALSLDTR